MGCLRLLAKFVEQPIRCPMAPEIVIRRYMLIKAGCGIATSARELVVLQIVATLRRSRLCWCRKAPNSRYARQTQRVTVADRISSDVGVRVDAAVQADWVAL